MNLVIVESPAKCKKIASFLGPTFTVLATMGHIRALDEDLDAVGIDRDFEPRFRFLKEKAKATKPIVDAAAKATTIYLAADDDREGEAIAYGVACLLKRDAASMPRAVFHEITATAVRNAIANPRRIDMNRVHAQQARAVLDMLVGFTISPLLWKHVARSLSAGRCQTPALRLVSDREKEINGHSTQTTWALSGTFQSNKFQFPAKMEDELEDQESALNYMENVYETPHAFVKESVNRQWTANPPKPLITSTLQQEASALHKLNPKTTMKIAQTLYEAGHITYMRTDHAILGEEAIEEAQEEVKKTWGEEYLGAAQGQAPQTKAKGKKESSTSSNTVEEAQGKSPGAKSSGAQSKSPGAQSPGAQEAHEAIRPTHFDLKELPAAEEWNAIDKKIYQLIWKRAIQSTMSPAHGKNRSVKIQIEDDPLAEGEGDSQFTWSSTWRSTDFQGWQIAGQVATLDDSEEEENSNEKSWKQSLLLVPGTKLTWTNLQAAPKRSKAAPRFTEATLIRELEKKGIGRPSTFASLIEVLFDKLYVEKKDISGTTINHTTLNIKPGIWPPLTQITQVALGSEKQKLVPTALGESVVSFAMREFPQLFSYDFTAQMESRLDRVSKGEEAWKGLCRDTWDSYKDSYNRLKDKASLPSASEKVRDFGNGFKAVMTKTGPILLQEAVDTSTEKSKSKSKSKDSPKPTFYTFPEGFTIQTITEEQARQHIASVKKETILGSWDDKPIEKKKGPYGDYLQCGDLRIPFNNSDTQEQIVIKFRERSATAENKYVFGPYTFSKGQYGPYMYKTDLKTKIFISIPDSTDVRRLTAEQADTIYKNGIEAKKAASSGRGGFRGGGRGRGR